jgi:predicted nucleic acid-binding protein
MSESKIKVYLDTNIIIDFFINQAKTIKNKVETKIPEKLSFLVNNLDRLEFVTSIITQAEIVRELTSGYGLNEKDIDELWKEFVKILDCKIIEKVVIDSRFVEIPMRIKMKLRTLMNFQHLFIAMEEGAYLISGDKDLIRTVRENRVYDRILSYIELRKIISSPCP